MQLKSDRGNDYVQVDIIGAKLYLNQFFESVALASGQAQEFLPILEHFIKTGELPDAS